MWPLQNASPRTVKNYLFAVFIFILSRAALFFITRYYSAKLVPSTPTSPPNLQNPSPLNAAALDPNYSYCQAAYPETTTYQPIPSARLQTLQIITRHGDRSPSLSLPYEPTPWDMCDTPSEIIQLDEMQSPSQPFIRKMHIPHATPSYWKGNCNLGQLTRRGHEQMRELGKVLKEIYVDGVVEWVGGPIMGLEDVHVRSTDVWRTIQAAQSLITSLFPAPNTTTTIPIPLHVHPKPIDTLSLPLHHCPRLHHLHTTSRKSPQYTNFKSLSTHLTKKLSTLLGFKSHEIDVGRWFDVIMCRRCWGMDVCGADGKCVPEELQVEVVQLAEWWKGFEYDTERMEETRLRVGPLIVELLDRFNMSRQPSHDDTDDLNLNQKRIHYYSAHDTTLSALLAVLGHGTERWPAYASSLVFELWERDGGDGRVVRILYNGRVLKGWCADEIGEGCDVKRLEEWVGNFLPRDMDGQCGV
ncbi:Acid phosphatase-like protein 2 [Rhizophlyctis rosea]|nr:Acid phosphatase-like protein 2 [Rhizophlyctis rosea]